MDKQKLLVVEDDRSIAVGLEYSLGQEGFGVTLCAGVADALEALADGRPIREVVADPSAASFITALRQAGFPVIKANNDVLSGIRITAGMLREKKLILCSNCTDCLREMELYCWNDRIERDAPRKENDHAMDDIRYFVSTLLPLEKEDTGEPVLTVERGGYFAERED